MSNIKGETIESAAILFNGHVYTLPPPARHWDVYNQLIRDHVKDGEMFGETQGFLTNTGRFVRREPAGRIAIKSGQITKLKFNSKALFSEDLW